MIIVLFFAGHSMGKGFVQIVIYSKSEIAQPIIDVKSDSKINITNLNSVGEYNFTVLNYNEDKVSQVDLKYFLRIEANVDDSIKFNLYKNGEEISLNENNSEESVLEKGKRQEDRYLLKIVYENNDKIKLEDMIEKVRIKVQAEQQNI